MYGVVLIAIIAAMGGAIAYIGDKLGTKVGKKKLTIFGLRPKHTSIIVTIVTGILIAAATLGILASTSRDVRTALFGMAALKAQLESLNQEVSTQNVELEVSRKALDAKNAEYTALTVKIKETSEKLSKITGELAEVTQERDKTAVALQTAQHDYSVKMGELASTKNELGKAKQDIDSLETTKKELDNKVTTLNESKNLLQSDIDRLNELTTNLQHNISTFRNGTVVYRGGENIYTGVANGSEGPKQIQNSLNEIFAKANQNILDRFQIGDKRTIALFIPTAAYDQAVNAIAANRQSTVVRISSTGNVIYGEVVFGTIELYANKLIYPAGSVVYSETIEAQTSKQAEEALYEFTQKVNAAAIKQGVLADPLVGTVGKIGMNEFYDAISKIKKLHGKIELSAVARKDIYTAGPLQITINIKQVL